MEHSDFALELKALTDDGTVEGYAAIFGNVDNGGDKIAPGAFVGGMTKARQSGRSIKMLWNHDPYQPIGVWEDLAEDAKGLWGKGRLVLDVPKAREIHALMKAGVISGLSIGYRTREAEPDGNVRVIKKADLFEISPVTFPMNERARISAVKSDGMDDVVNKLRAGDRLTEREFELMAKGLGLSNSQAERAARIHLKGPGEPAEAAKDGAAFMRAFLGLSA
ncbi:HK97 family phage prohead protease [Rhodovulum sulfidophilum]|uniref:HK97 family phage prohead protease n=2 Tax=Rhodovulum sulfidophilum TaxID=35806 RepID=A0ABS1RRP3_RHOSU|nr:HK97 family phage prohead protease [Rhodovulum sulfidophilum]MBL3608212.1 HK97 family phage prohead protease [Rhodovulum sulfidophilum]MCE8456307.1 HK97 family phage prohead protease [Rhodovulum sulfidophilum]